MRSLVQVLRLVDDEKKLTMKYIYEAMDKAKEAIEKSFNNCKLYHLLHATVHFLNSQYFYNDPSIDQDYEVSSRLYNCINRLSLNHKCMFGTPTIRQRSTIAPNKFKLHFVKLKLHDHSCKYCWNFLLSCGSQYNQNLKDHCDNKDLIDPTLLDNIDDCNE
ncbi:hypothetical protein CR513_16680, partial [Mucuna pruriens]